MMAAHPLAAGANHAPQALLTQRARQLAGDGLQQRGIMVALKAEFPGLASENHYANPAAITVMERIRGRQKEAQRLEAHNAWRISRGMPALETEDEEPEEPGEPDAAELAAVTNGRELLRLCGRYGIAIAYDDASGSLQPSRPIDTTGPLAVAIRRYRSSLMKMDSAQRASP